MDQDKERGDIAELYAAKQPGENDQEDILQIALGVSYSYGGNSPRDVLGDTLPFAQWASVTEGVIE